MLKRHLVRKTRLLAASCAAAASIAAALVLPALASASPLNAGLATTIAGSASLGSYDAVDSDNITSSWDFLYHVSAHANWNGSLVTNLGWHSENVRQGAALDVARISPLQSGEITVVWSVKGSFLEHGYIGDLNRTLTKKAYCQPSLQGSDYTCTARSDDIEVYALWGQPASPYINLVLGATFKVTPEGAIVTRGLNVAGSPAGATKNLGLDLGLATDTNYVPCGAVVGSAASYKLSPYHWTPAVTVSQYAVEKIGMMDPITGFTEFPAMSEKPVGTTHVSHPAFDLQGTAGATSLGPVLANNVPPTMQAMNYTGKVGIPVSFHAAESHGCPINNYVWKFSNGTTSYGQAPSRTFAKAGTYDGELTVTDTTGLKAVRDFTVTISK